MAAAAPAGTVNTIGLAGSAALVTFTNPAVIAAALYTILYWSGVPVVAEYVRFADVVPLHTDGFAPRVIVGVGLIVTVIAELLLTHPVALFLTVSVAL